MTRQLPAVTVMMAAYNYAGFIHGSLDSALSQDYPPELLDIVIVDDGSTDATPEVLAEYQRRHPDRITVIRQETAGYVAATNTAPAAARGELLAVLDADDLWPPHKTDLQTARLLEDDAIGLVDCDTQVLDPYDAVLRQSVWEWLEQDPQCGPEVFAQIMARPGDVAPSSTIMLRAELAEDVFPIPLRAPYQDWWVTARIAAVAKSTGWMASRPLSPARREHDVVSEPQLLSAYASAFAEADDVTLAVAAIGLSEDRAVRAISGAAERAALDMAVLPDALLITHGRPAALIELERRADTVLTRRVAKLVAPAFKPEYVAELRALVPA